MTWPLVMKSKEAANYLGMSDSWLRKQRVRGTGPCFFRCGGAIRYQREVLDDWMESQMSTNTLKLTNRVLKKY